MQARSCSRLWQRAAIAPSQAACYDTASTSGSYDGGQEVRWVFLGPPGVGKGTYASRMAKALGVPHIAAGDLVRAEIKSGSSLGKQMKSLVDQGRLLPDELIAEILQQKLRASSVHGQEGFILDGFPRTRPQAALLSQVADVSLAVNLQLRQEVLIAKCLGRRECGKCGKGYNIADIYLPATAGRPEIIMPPLSPPPQCAPFMQSRSDDTEDVVQRRLQVYGEEAQPVEDYYRDRGLLLDFEITGGIPETEPRLWAALQPYATAQQELSEASA